MIRPGPLAACCALAVSLAGGIAALRGPARAAEQANAQPKPYAIENGRVGLGIFHGYLFYGEYCLRCHGPDGAGSSYAPSLVDSLKTMSEYQFKNTVINGKQDVSAASQLVMPAFGTVADVVLHLDDIYHYLKARSEGKIGRGRPKRIGESDD